MKKGASGEGGAGLPASAASSRAEASGVAHSNAAGQPARSVMKLVPREKVMGSGGSEATQGSIALG
jgi:hypothetical protein